MLKTNTNPDASPYLEEEHHQVRAMVREFALAEVAPIAAALDEEKRFPSETIPKLAALGLLGIPWPQEFGGAAPAYRAYCILLGAPSRASATPRITAPA